MLLRNWVFLYDDLEFWKYKAKLSFDKIRAVESNPVGKLILVTAINPTPAGEGKSTIPTIGLADALEQDWQENPDCYSRTVSWPSNGD